jgi:hypothetical protein
LLQDRWQRCLLVVAGHNDRKQGTVHSRRIQNSEVSEINLLVAYRQQVPVLRLLLALA